MESQRELVFVFKYGRHEHRNNVQLGRFGRNRSNVWHYPGANSFARDGAEERQRIIARIGRELTSYKSQPSASTTWL